jgi:hypothetical protein
MRCGPIREGERSLERCVEIAFQAIWEYPLWVVSGHSRTTAYGQKRTLVSVQLTPELSRAGSERRLEH